MTIKISFQMITKVCKTRNQGKTLQACWIIGVVRRFIHPRTEVLAGQFEVGIRRRTDQSIRFFAKGKRTQRGREGGGR